MDQDELIRRSLHDLSYFECIILNYRSRLYRYIRSISGLSTEDIEEILQETFVKLYRHLDHYIFDKSFESWLFRIAHNQTIDTLRRRQRFAQSHCAWPEDEAKLSHLSTEEQPPNQEQAAIENELNDRLKSAIEAIPAPYKETAKMRFLEHKSYQEISTLIDKPIGTISVQLQRSKQLLIARLRNEESSTNHPVNIPQSSSSS